MMTVNEDVRRALDTHRRSLAEGIVARHYELEAENWRPFGSAGRERCVRDANYHLMYLAEAIGMSSPPVFGDYVSWLQSLFAGLGFPADSVAVTIDCMRHTIGRDLPPRLSAIADEYLAMAAARVERDPAPLVPFVQESGQLASLATRYLRAVLDGERDAAIRLIVAAAGDGTPVRDIYLHVFQPAQREVGRLWQTNQISVAQEHFCTAVTQLAMAQLYPYVFATEKSGLRLIIACIDGELHEIGPRVLADLFEMDGWDTHYLGANTPARSIVREVEERRPHILAVSATMAFHVRSVAGLVEQVRASSAGDSKIMVGGYPFNVDPDLWRCIGADGSARDASEAIGVAQRLVVGE